MTSPVLRRAHDISDEFLDSLATRPVAPPVDPSVLRTAIDVPLPDHPGDPLAALQASVEAVEPGLVASAGPRYFGFVIGGRDPVALAADWLVSTWDQFVSTWVGAPAMAEVELTTGRWIIDLLDLPTQASVGFTTGATQSNLVGIAAGHTELLRRRGWDVERRGLRGAPRVPVVVGAARHSTVDLALRVLGIGQDEITVVGRDSSGAMLTDGLADLFASFDAEPLVIAQAGQVATGACDRFDRIAAALDGKGWIHIDGAFGLWLRTIPGRRHLVAGAELADSWAVDAHKWLNVPYDSAMVIVRSPEAHRAVTGKSGAYLMASDGLHDPEHYVIEFSRRARAFPTYVLLRSLGRSGVEERLERCCRLATRFAEAMGGVDDVTVLGEVVANQVLLRLDPDDDVARDALARFQASGIGWAGSTVWDGRFAMRFSVSNWSTTEADIDVVAAALADACAAARAAST